MNRRALPRALFATFLILFPPGCATTAPEMTPAEAEAKAEAELGAPLVNCNRYSGKQECCSRAACSGKVLSNRDRHNCAVKSHGTSWHNASGSTCVRP